MLVTVVAISISYINDLSRQVGLTKAALSDTSPALQHIPLSVIQLSMVGSVDHPGPPCYAALPSASLKTVWGFGFNEGGDDQ